MPEISRREVLGILGAGAVAAGGGTAALAFGSGRSPAVPADLAPGGENAVKAENRLAGSSAWKIGADRTRAADDREAQIAGYTSATSVNVGEALDFHISTRPAQEYKIAVYRLGHYGGDSARLVTTSPKLHGREEPAPSLDSTTGLITCSWSVAWTLDVPSSWVSGSYLAVFTTSDGYRAYHPFVVRDDNRSSAVLAVLPFTTYQAYNQWPLDEKIGKSLYYGYGRATGPGEATATSPDNAGAPISYGTRAHKVSFDRPYAGPGLPLRADLDHDTVQWLEEAGYDVTYATSVDLHEGRVDPKKYKAMVFTGHDEYWSQPMRDVVSRGIAGGTGMAYLSANNVYWHVRFEDNQRTMVCYKTDPDPAPDESGDTMLWREMEPKGAHAEQGLLGIQYTGIVKEFAPLVVKGADHWLWAGTGVRDGDQIEGIVGGEADALVHGVQGPQGVTQTLLAESQFHLRNGKKARQNTSVYETASGTVMFVAGTFNWPLGLNRDPYRDDRIRRATANLLKRMTA